MSVKDKLDKYDTADDIHQYQLVLDATKIFLEEKSSVNLKTGIRLFKTLNNLSYIGSLRQYENDYDLQNKILYARIRVFKACIPDTHIELRNLTETLVGMKEGVVS